MKTEYPPPGKFTFHAGPYLPPKLKVGTKVRDMCIGDVLVAGRSQAPIPWPAYVGKTGRHVGPMPIFTGGLVRAVCEELEIVVAHYWGVSRYIVNRWKCAIAEAEDSNVVAVNIALLRTDPGFRKKHGYPQ